jgi:hypothetical protein
METNKQLLQQEGIIRETRCTWFLTKIKAYDGAAIMTRQRLAFYYHGNPIVGILLKTIFKKLGAHVMVSIPLSDIETVQATKVGINKNLFEVITRQGKSYKILPTGKAADWIAALQMQLTQI